MKKNYRLAAGILVVFFCILLGCEKREKEQEELLLLPVNDAEPDAGKEADTAEQSCSRQKQLTGPKIF